MGRHGQDGGAHGMRAVSPQFPAHTYKNSNTLTRITSNNKLLVICGQTGTGKSGLAIELAQKFNGEIISADSRQVYTGLNISSGKLNREEMHGIPHHLIDVTDLSHDFSVAEYKEQAQEVITDIHARGKLPIICGGTGQYIQALTTPQTLPPVPANQKLRELLEEKSITELFALLTEKDPARAQTIDQHNKVRLIRALEIIEALGHVPPPSLYAPLQASTNKDDILFIGLAMPKEELVERIRVRIDASLDLMIAEVQNLHETQNIPWSRLERLGLWPERVAKYLQKEISYTELVRDMNTETWQYAKRQKTWFQRDPRIVWFHPIADKERILEVTTKFLL